MNLPTQLHNSQTDGPHLPAPGTIERPFLLIDLYRRFGPPERLLLGAALSDREAALQAADLLRDYRWATIERGDLFTAVVAHAHRFPKDRPARVIEYVRTPVRAVARWAIAVPPDALAAALPVESIVAVLRYGDAAFAADCTAA